MLTNLKNPITSAYYDVQHVCTYLQPFSHKMSQQQQNYSFFRGWGYPYMTPSLKESPLTPGHKILPQKN